MIRRRHVQDESSKPELLVIACLRALRTTVVAEKSTSLHVRENDGYRPLRRRVMVLALLVDDEHTRALVSCKQEQERHGDGAKQRP